MEPVAAHTDPSKALTMTSLQLQNQAHQQATQLPAQLTRQIPEELRNLTKAEVNFFMDRIPTALKSGSFN